MIFIRYLNGSSSSEKEQNKTAYENASSDRDVLIKLIKKQNFIWEIPQVIIGNKIRPHLARGGVLFFGHN